MLLRITSVGCAVSTGTINAPIQQCGGCPGFYALGAQELQGRGQRAALLRRRTLPVFRQIGEHGKQHEAAHEGDRLIEREGLKACRQAARVGDAAITVDGGGPDGLDALEQCLAAVVADYVAQKLAEESNVGVLSDGGGSWGHKGESCLSRRRYPTGTAGAHR